MLSAVLRNVLPILIFTTTALSPGCLLGRVIVGPDAETEYLIAPVIVEDPTKTSPLPNSFIRLGPQQSSTTFRISVAFDRDDEPLTLRLFVDRPRICLTQGECENFIEQTLDTDMIQPGHIRTITRSVPNLQLARHCYRVDIYIARSFQPNTDGFGRFIHLPRRDNEVAHGRWYILTPDSFGVITDDIYRQCAEE